MNKPVTGEMLYQIIGQLYVQNLVLQETNIQLQREIVELRPPVKKEVEKNG